MSTPEFKFDGAGIAEKYDEILVPVMFEPWANLLLEQMPPDPDWDILDLATGTGIVASKITQKLERSGTLICADISPAMLEAAKVRVGSITSAGNVSFQEAPADCLDIPDESVDAIYCQQGFQFFPDKKAAAIEISRVLKPGGNLVLATWCPVIECKFFQLIVDCLESMGLESIAAKMRIPFDYMPEDKLREPFHDANFESIEIIHITDQLVFPEGAPQAYRTVFGTPIGPDLAGLDDENRELFKSKFLAGCETLISDGVMTTALSSLFLTAGKSRDS